MERKVEAFLHCVTNRFPIFVMVPPKIRGKRRLWVRFHGGAESKGQKILKNTIIAGFNERSGNYHFRCREKGKNKIEQKKKSMVSPLDVRLD